MTFSITKTQDIRKKYLDGKKAFEKETQLDITPLFAPIYVCNREVLIRVPGLWWLKWGYCINKLGKKRKNTHQALSVFMNVGIM